MWQRPEWSRSWSRMDLIAWNLGLPRFAIPPSAAAGGVLCSIESIDDDILDGDSYNSS